MKHLLHILLLLVLSCPSFAELVTLRSGQIVRGEIVLQNDEVVIIRTNNGMRHQYPASEVVSIRSNESIVAEQTVATTPIRPVNIALQLHGGVLVVPELGTGGQFGLDFMIGSRAIQGKRMFVGGSVGYRAKVIGSTTYSFVPLLAHLQLPLTEQKHAPLLGMSIGYGFAANKHDQGGICLSANFGGSYLINQQASLQYGVYAEWQQAQTDVVQYIDNIPYTNHMGCNFLAIGVKFAVLF
jgi:hypothetical protein